MKGRWCTAIDGVVAYPIRFVAKTTPRRADERSVIRRMSDPIRRKALRFSALRRPILPSSLSDLKNRSENSAERGQILPVLQVNNHFIDQKRSEIWTAQANLQPISFKSDRLLGYVRPLWQQTG